MTRQSILNVDSVSETRSEVSRILSQEYVCVREAHDAAECLRLAQESDASLIVISAVLDDAFGADLCQRLGSITSAKRILRVRAPLPHEMESGIPGCGADAYISEPVHPAILAATARTLMRLCEAERERDEAARLLTAAKDELHWCLSRASHDLSEPVRAVSTLVELIRAGGIERLAASEAQYMEHVTDSVHRSRRLLQYLTSYAQAGRDAATSYRNFDFGSAVVAAQSQLRSEVEQCQAEILTGPLPAVHGNPGRLQQLMTGLLANSLKYRKNGVKPMIAIHASRDAGNRWRIAVTDNGIGISPQYHSKIFAPFQRLHGREVPGTGMGLAVCRKIVEAHGGTLGVESIPDQGATFFFTLAPAMEEGLSAEPGAGAREPGR